MVSKPFAERQSAENAETAFKQAATKAMRSVGGEFFVGDWVSAESIFAQIPGVARFSRLQAT